MEYTIVCSSDLQRFIVGVQDKIDNGWEFHGSLIVERSFYIREMVKNRVYS